MCGGARPEPLLQAGMASVHGEGALARDGDGDYAHRDAERIQTENGWPAEEGIHRSSADHLAGVGLSSSSTAGRTSASRDRGAPDGVEGCASAQANEAEGGGSHVAGHVSGWMEELAEAAGEAEEAPRNPFDEYRQVEPHISAPLRAGAYYYLINRRWYVEWLQWVGHPDTQSPKLHPMPDPVGLSGEVVLMMEHACGKDKIDESCPDKALRGGGTDSPTSAAKRTRTHSWTKERPGPINNRELLETEGSTALRKEVNEHQDYEIISEDAWNLIHSWYGGGPAIKRRAIQCPSGATQVELHGLRLKVYKSSDTEAPPLEVIESKLTTVKEFKEHICREMGLDTEKTRIWDYFNQKPYALIDDKPNDSLEACRIFDENPILLEEQTPQGAWKLDTKKESNVGSFNDDNDTSGGHFSYGASSSSADVPSIGTPIQRGVVGLQNLGNTCFMNSSLQCLSNIPPLREYFTSMEYKNSLNRNAYKTQGKLAEAFAALLSMMWRQDTTRVAPRNFKYQVGQFAEQFSGYGQQDSMELIEYVLDGLKEDCNRVTGAKPYIEVKEADGRSDEEVAAEAMDNYRRRSNSRIDDLFVGLFKSVVKCPAPPELCGRASVTFDPFLSAKLPLVTTAEQRMTQFSLTFVRDTCPPGASPVIQVTVKVSKDHSVKELIEAAAREVEGLRPQQCLLVEIWSKKVQKFFEEHEAIDNIRSDDVLVLLEVAEPKAFSVPSEQRWGVAHMGSENGDHSPTVAASLCGAIVYHREEASPDRIRELRGLPMFLSISKQVTGQELCKQVERKLREIVFGPGETLTQGWALYKVPKYSPTTEGTLISPDSTEPLDLRDSKENFVVEWTEDATLPSRLKKDEDMMNNVQSHRPDRGDGEQELSQLLKWFTEEERLGADDAWYCNKCKEHKEAFKKLEFHRTPPVLVLQLKRFQFTRWSRERLNTPVRFPLEGLDISPYCTESSRRNENSDPAKTTYDLAALSKHIGSLGGGHYVAYCRSSQDGEWYNFDDGMVRQVSAAEVEEDKVGAYVLFYIRRDHRPQAFGPPASSP